MFEDVILTIENELTQNEFDVLLQFTSPEKQKRIKQFLCFKDARNCLLGDILTRLEICRCTGHSINQLEFSTNNHGKPLLLGIPNIHFNISHTGNYVVCAISDEPVGIDIEIMKDTDSRIAKRFFTPDETEYITAVAGEQRNRFYEVWTKKESRIKWEGKGLSKPLSSFSVFDTGDEEQIFYHEVFINDEAICHVCSTKRVKPSVILINKDEFMNVIYTI